MVDRTAPPMTTVACPKCGFEEPESATECSRCGIVFGKYGSRLRVPSPSGEGAAEPRGRGAELKILGVGLTAAVVVYAIPFTRFVFSAIITLFHEFGHAVVGW